MSIRFLGATQTVTGSKYLLECDGESILIDCGLYQGEYKLVKKNWDKLDIDISKLTAIIISHAHLDHTGHLPKLIREGFRGKIYATPITCALTEIILKDAASIQLQDANKIAKTNKKHIMAKPLYYANDVAFTMKHFEALEYNKKIQLGAFEIVLFQAGHIPGAASIGISYPDGDILFSGDLGRDNDLLTFDPQVERPFKNVVIESTYGGLFHSKKTQQDEIKSILELLKYSKGTLLIPTFSLSRTQLLIYLLKEAMDLNPSLKSDVYLNSPMAIKINKVFTKHSDDMKVNFNEIFENFSHLKVMDEHWMAKNLYNNTSSKIILSASGMLTGGRVLKHIELLCEDEKNIIFLPGYQAEGTLGKALVEGEKNITVNNKELFVKAKIIHSHAFSAHADSTQLLKWLSLHKDTMNNIFITHGEILRQESLMGQITDHFPQVNVYKASSDEPIEL